MKSLAAVLFATLLVSACSNAELEDRVKKLEEIQKKDAEVIDFLHKVYDQQKQQDAQQKQAAAQRERDEPAPDAVFAVDIAADIKGGQVEGSNAACVTIVEAWDFA